ncbi:MAG: hypothetical protein QOE76_2491 [Frankiales bacterium]|jgi:hypothetical protein|nr:hypothetical protein [Frankiales bacterium]
MARYPGPTSPTTPLAAELYRQAAVLCDGARILAQASLPGSVWAAAPLTVGMDLSVRPDDADLMLLAQPALSGVQKRALGTRLSAVLSRRWAATVKVRVGVVRASTVLGRDGRLQIRLPFPEAAELIAPHILAERDASIAGIRGRLHALGKQPPVRGGVNTHQDIRRQSEQENGVWKLWLHQAVTSERPRWAPCSALEESCQPEETCRSEAPIDWEVAAVADGRTPGVLALLRRKRGIGESKIRRPGCTTPMHSHYRGSPLEEQACQAEDHLEELDPLLAWWNVHEQETVPVLEQMVSLYGCFAATVAPEVLRRHVPALAALARMAPKPTNDRFLLRSLVALHLHRLGVTNPRELTCPFCAAQFFDHTLGEELVRWCGPARWCPNCAQDSLSAIG